MTKFISKDNLTTFYSLLKQKAAMLDSDGNVPLSMLGNVDTELFVVLTELPSLTSGYANNKIYLVPTSVSETGNVYGEYIVVKDAWEKLGEFKADVDLSGYLTLDEAETRYANRTETFAAIQKKVDKVDGKALSSNDFTDELKTKLEGIEEGAQANVDAYKEVSLPDSNLSMYAGDHGNILTIQGKGGTTVSGDVLTGSITIGSTTYTAATTSANGLMSSSDKTKLNGVATGAQVNVLESVKIDGTAQTITSKAVNLETCTTSEITAIFS